MSHSPTDSVANFCKLLPKIELHAHINGSLSRKILKELGCMEASIENYRKSSQVTLEEVFKLFKIAQNSTNTKKNVYTATKSVICDFAKENVIYLELRTTPRAEECMTKEEYIESVVKAIQDSAALDIIVKIILSIDRRHSKKVSGESLELIVKMKDKYPDIIRGIDLSGDPSCGTFDEELFHKARLNGLKLTIHCAEVTNNEEVEKILKFAPDRLGHCTSLHPKYGGCQRNWDLYCEKNIPVECCLTSNVICGTSKNYKDHHINEWIKNSKPFCINTDDKGVFCTSLSMEFEHVARNFIINPKDLWKVTYNSVEFSFATDQEKVYLKERLLNWFNDMDSRSGFPKWTPDDMD